MGCFGSGSRDSEAQISYNYHQWGFVDLLTDCLCSCSWEPAYLPNPQTTERTAAPIEMSGCETRGPLTALTKTPVEVTGDWETGKTIRMVRSPTRP